MASQLADRAWTIRELLEKWDATDRSYELPGPIQGAELYALLTSCKDPTEAFKKVTVVRDVHTLWQNNDARDEEKKRLKELLDTMEKKRSRWWH